MTTLVAGGSGYAGKIMVSRLRETGAGVRVLDRVDKADRSNDVEFHRCDARGPTEVRRAMQGVYAAHHNVAQVPPAKDSERFRSVNVDGTRIALDEASRAEVGKVVLVSSSAVY